MTVHKALLARLEAKPGKEAAVRDLLISAVALANQEARTTVWFALKLGPSTFGVFDAFADEDGRQAHLNGPIAQALMANAQELLSKVEEHPGDRSVALDLLAADALITLALLARAEDAPERLAEFATELLTVDRGG